jgi:hypothetical protein
MINASEFVEDAEYYRHDAEQGYAQAQNALIEMQVNHEESSNMRPQASSKSGCYIATAVYGSYNAPPVLILRRFRDEVLAPSSLGRSLISMYYTVSPPIAKGLQKATSINLLVRRLLDRFVLGIAKKYKW